jgi:CheY-like chemotaxis protein
MDARDAVRRTAEDFLPLMEERGVVFDTVLPEGTVWIDADATRIAQVIGNLLHNAAKFARAGDRVTLALAARDGHAEIAVRDTGVGVEPALLGTIFDAFVQGRRTLARSEGGLGLGLALVKGIAELHGGSVRAESAGLGHGAEFLVRLPFVSAAEAQPSPAPPLRRAAERRVLVVDDNVDAAESLAEVVELLGHAAEIAYDGPTALAMARASAPDVVLCDLGLPGMSGYEVARSLRAAGSRCRLIAVSGYALPEDVRNAVSAGFDGHLAKPAAFGDLERLLL